MDAKLFRFGTRNGVVRVDNLPNACSLPDGSPAEAMLLSGTFPFGLRVRGMMLAAQALSEKLKVCKAATDRPRPPGWNRETQAQSQCPERETA